jgi:hypothetical protein
MLEWLADMTAFREDKLFTQGHIALNLPEIVGE